MFFAFIVADLKYKPSLFLQRLCMLCASPDTSGCSIRLTQDLWTRVHLFCFATQTSIHPHIGGSSFCAFLPSFSSSYQTQKCTLPAPLFCILCPTRLCLIHRSPTSLCVFLSNNPCVCESVYERRRSWNVRREIAFRFMRKQDENPQTHFPHKIGETACI